MDWVQARGAGTGIEDAAQGAIGSMLGVIVPLLIVIVLFQVGLGLLARAIRRARQGERPKRGWRKPHAMPIHQPASRSVPTKFDAVAEQMRAVGESGFEKRRLLNKEEFRVLPVLERGVREAGQGHRVMAQTSLGEVIRPVAGSPDEALAAINSKRLDFAVFDRWGMIVCAVEYQGTGHWQGQAAMRDGVKREVLRKAGVRLLDVHPDFVDATLAQSVRDLLAGGRRSGMESS